jgi:hypothetical protein
MKPVARMERWYESCLMQYNNVTNYSELNGREMDFRIEISREKDHSIIQVAGELNGRGVGELERLCRKTTGRLSIDITNLRNSTPGGVQLIRELLQQGVTVLGISPYMALLLEM